MVIRVTRKFAGRHCTAGTLRIDGEVFCDTLEPKDRGFTPTTLLKEIRRLKAYGKTAIPTGHYVLDCSRVSTAFRRRPWASAHKGIVPRIMGVKGFDGVLIHVGNTVADTSGCILVGIAAGVDRLVSSAETYRRMMTEYLLPAAERGEAVKIEIEREY